MHVLAIIQQLIVVLQQQIYRGKELTAATMILGLRVAEVVV
jgi:hypothetical protein